MEERGPDPADQPRPDGERVALRQREGSGEARGLQLFSCCSEKCIIPSFTLCSARVLSASAHGTLRAVAGLLLSVRKRDEGTLKDGRSVPGRAATYVSGDSNEKWHCRLLVVLSVAVLRRRVLSLAHLGHMP
ncbi:hypothetical protein NDU88_000653 [Pleurodeles waltl]|uniref:Uncharacterized protein n=1 Tax=Pleurodeles waltl TaxID=8319 RepID=A0AAV7P5K4_PLEWA|nr:hypothetical protein NDU88_000653 [Pleurodeles waltl]